MNCIFCHNTITTVTNSNLTVSKCTNGKAVSTLEYDSYDCDDCDVLFRTCAGNIFAIWFYDKPNEIYNISFYEDDNGWFTRFYAGHEEDPALEFNHLFWIFPSNLQYWVNRFKSLIIVS